MFFFFGRTIFVRLDNCSFTFQSNWIWQNADILVFSAAVQEKEESVEFALTFNFWKMIWAFAIKNKEKFSKIWLFSQKKFAQIDI